MDNTIIIIEKDNFELTSQMKSILDERVNEDESTYLSAEDSINKLNEKFCEMVFENN